MKGKCSVNRSDPINNPMRVRLSLIDRFYYWNEFIIGGLGMALPGPAYLI